MLKPINAQDLIFSYDIGDDRTNTFLTLNDYDWMEYILSTRFRTEEQGILEVRFEYYGFVESSMFIKQTKPKTDKQKDTEVCEYEYRFSTALFAKYIKEFMTAHMAAWDEQYAFNGEEYVIAFYNDVLNQGTLISKNIL